MYRSLRESQYKPFVPSSSELRNLISEDLLPKIRKVDPTDFEIEGVRFHFLRDSSGNTYAKDYGELKPLYEFLERFKRKTENYTSRYYSPKHERTMTITRHVYHSCI